MCISVFSLQAVADRVISSFYHRFEASLVYCTPRFLVFIVCVSLFFSPLFGFVSVKQLKTIPSDQRIIVTAVKHLNSGSKSRKGKFRVAVYAAYGCPEGSPCHIVNLDPQCLRGGWMEIFECRERAEKKGAWNEPTVSPCVNPRKYIRTSETEQSTTKGRVHSAKRQYSKYLQKTFPCRIVRFQNFCFASPRLHFSFKPFTDILDNNSPSPPPNKKKNLISPS